MNLSEVKEVRRCEGSFCLGECPALVLPGSGPSHSTGLEYFTQDSFAHRVSPG